MLKKPYKVGYSKNNKQKITSFSTQKNALQFTNKLKSKNKIYKTWVDR